MVSLQLFSDTGHDVQAADLEGSPIYVRAGQMVDVRTGRILSKQVMVVKGGIIAKVGAESEVARPEGAEVIDLSGAWVLPGLVDCHVHLASDKGGVDRLVAGVTQSTAKHAYEAAVNAVGLLDLANTRHDLNVCPGAEII